MALLRRFTSMAKYHTIGSKIGEKVAAAAIDEPDFLPPSIDWRERGAVTSVKNQRGCGSCWAFSAVGAVEGLLYIRTKKLISLSTQEVVDYDRWSYGCDGGWIESAFLYIRDHGITTEECYPYRGKLGKKYEVPNNPRFRIDGFKCVPPMSEHELMRAVARQPVSTWVDATGWVGGSCWRQQVYDGPGYNLKHCVLIVGYGTEPDGTNYWILKNSWGPNFGQSGYIKVARGMNSFGVETWPSYPIVKENSAFSSYDGNM